VGHTTLLGSDLSLEKGLTQQSGEILLPSCEEEGGLLFLHLNHFTEMLTS